jgi:hypothetical protein
MGAYEQQAPTGEPLNVVEFVRGYLRSMADTQLVRGLIPPQRAAAVCAVADELDDLLFHGRVTCIFDALDEMPQESYSERYAALRTFIRSWEEYGNRFVFSCRSLDYDPSFGVDEVIIEPFDRHRIKKFLVQHVPVVADRLYDAIRRDEELEEIVSNPFFLQALAYINTEVRREPDGSRLVRLPGSRGQLVRKSC